VSELTWTDPDGVIWTFVERPRVRQGERHDWVILIAQSANDTRIARCGRHDWAAGTVDCAQLLADSVPAGASRKDDEASEK
jgi:hypothetical protein